MTIGQAPKSHEFELDPAKIEHTLEEEDRLRFLSPRARQEVVAGVIRVHELAQLGVLDEAKTAALENGPGRVAHLAPQLPHSERHFGGLNNYFVHFMENHSAAPYRERPAYQRFAIIYPELDAYLLEIGQGLLTANNPDIPREIIAESYDLMTPLVDVGDPGVIRDGQVLDIYLCS